MSGAFQSFFLMFKNDAKKSAMDVRDLDKQIGELAAKGKTRNVEEMKQLAALRKQRQEMNRDLADQKKDADETGKSFLNLAESATKAAVAVVSAAAMKNGIINAQEFNRTLTTQTKLWGQNANEIAGYGAAVKAAGGTAQQFLGWYDQQRQNAASRGQKAMPLGALMDHIHQQVKGVSPEMAQAIFQQYGLSDPGAQTMLSGSDEEYSKAKSSGLELAKNTEAGAASAKQFGTAWDNLTSSLTKFWTTVNTEILPIASKLIDELTNFFNVVANNKGAALAVFAGMAAGGLAFAAASPAIIGAMTSIGFAAAGAAGSAIGLLSVLGRLGAVGAIVATGIALPGAARAGGAGIAHWINRQRGRGDVNGVLPGHDGYSGASGGTAMEYLMQKYGLDADHAAAIVSNMNAESGGRTGAIGDSGLARGLFQWHPDRQAKIRAGTGIDVTSAGRDQQLDAMMWEMKSRGQLNPFLAQSGAYNAGAYFSTNFEAPRDKLGQAMARGNAALQIAGNTPFASNSAVGGPSGGPAISIGSITVHSQATDANGIARDIAGSLDTQIRGVYAQNNDAVAY